MRTIDQIRALLITCTDETERNALMDEWQKAVEARAAGDGEKPTKAQEMRSQLAELVTARSGLVVQVEEITRGAVDEKGEARDYTPDEAEKRGRLLAQVDALDERHTSLEDQVRQAETDAREQRMKDTVAQMRRDLGLGEGIDVQGINGVGVREIPVYERGNGVSYLKDLTVRAFGPGLGSSWSQASERLALHGQQNHVRALAAEEKATRSDSEQYFVRQMIEQFSDRESGRGVSVAPGFLSYRALSTASTAGGEFVPPMFLTDQWIKFLRAGRVVANCQHHEDLPDGTMSINIPKVTAGTSVAAQGTQNTNVSMTDLQTAFVTFPVVTFAGQQIVSLQLLERSPIAFDQIVMGDLALAHAQYVDQQVLTGTGTGGQVTGILNTSGINTVSWTTGTGTGVTGIYGQLGLAKLAVATSMFMPATDCFMAPVVWEFISQTVDTQNRPIVVPEYAGPFNAIDVTADDATAEGAVGRRLNGLATYEDNNIPQNLGGSSNQSVIVVSRAQENILYESPVVTRALPQTFGAQLSVLLQLFNYGAFTAARYPNANSVITGSKLASTALVYNS
jgi:HK97 family phage major capsid protein